MKNSITTLDLLFRTKLDSPQLHQVALVSLIQRSDVLARLLGEPAAVTDVRWPGADDLRDFDFVVELSGGARVWVALEVDAPLRRERLRKQLAAVTGEDRALFVLLGASAVTFGRRWPEWESAGERLVIRDAGALLTALAELRASAAGHLLAPEVERLRVEYHRQLEALDARASGFASKPVAAWGAHDFLGFFERCRRFAVGGMGSAEIQHMVRRAGDHVSCRWMTRPVREDGSIATHLQFDDARLVVKITIQEPTRRAELRNQAFELLSALPAGPPLEVERPARFGHGGTMTLAIIGGVAPVADPGSPGFQSRIRTAEALFESFSRQLAAGAI